MALVDSIAEFTVRVQQLNLAEHRDRMTGVGVTTFAGLAFFSGFLPGGTEEVFNNSLALPLLGSADHIHRPALRRLLIEAYTLASADLQRRVEPRNDLPLLGSVDHIHCLALKRLFIGGLCHEAQGGVRLLSHCGACRYKAFHRNGI